MTTINRFDGDYDWLSNFYRHEQFVTLPGGHRVQAASAEHAYQASKTVFPVEQVSVLNTFTPGQAKRAGRVVTLRADWETAKLDVMAAVLAEKFTDPALRAKLLATHPHTLVEGNTWGDTFWGVCYGKGANNLGHCLMNLRASLLDTAPHDCSWCGHTHPGGPEHCPTTEPHAHTT